MEEKQVKWRFQKKDARKRKESALSGQRTHENYKALWKMTQTVGFRIMGLFMIVVTIGTLIFELFYIESVLNYYYSNVAGVLEAQARYDSELYLSYVSNDDFTQVVLENKNQFYRANRMQVQLLSNNGTVLFDNQGTSLPGTQLNTEDIRQAQENQSGVFVGRLSYSSEPLMALSYPLRDQTRQVGILRLTTSLESINLMILKKLIPSFFFSIFVILFGGLLSFLVSRSIVVPIKKLTAIAQRYSNGNFSVRADETSRGEVGELARTMNQMSDNIQEKEVLKNDFISSVSHELRTPLTSIKGWAITLQSDGIQPDIVSEGLKIIEKESERLGSMVEDLLDFSRFSSGRMTMSKTLFNVVDMAKRILVQMEPRIEEKSLHITYHFDSEDIQIYADEDRMKQVLLNLLDNAVKFTDTEGTVFLDIVQEKDSVVMTVTDTGIGISEEEIGLVTEKFWKGSSSQSHSGLGLSICEEIVKAHQGTLTIKSKLGTGTSVIVTLPAIWEPKEE